MGTLNTAAETWAGGGVYLLQNNAPPNSKTNQNPVRGDGNSSLSASASNRFTLQLQTPTATGAAGLLDGFNPAESHAQRPATTTGGIVGFDVAEFLVNSRRSADATGTS